MSTLILDQAENTIVAHKDWGGANLLEVPVPEKTSSYSPVSHRAIIDMMGEMIDSKNLKIKDLSYAVGRGGQQLIGKINLDGDDPVMGNSVVFRNSYDKSMSVAAVCGTNVWICSNGMIGGDVNIQFARKHTGAVNQEIITRFRDAFNDMNKNFDMMKVFEEQSKMRSMHPNKMAMAMGFMIRNKVIRPMHGIAAISEIDKSENFKEHTLWDAYNHCTEALKKVAPTEYMSTHQNVHAFWEKRLK